MDDEIYLSNYARTKLQIKDFGRWIPDCDTDTLMIKCPCCNGRMIVYLWDYEIYYRFCPYCGEELIQANFFSEME